ncbi:MAG: nucleotidyltransferase domain-containing protein [Actinomycetota bacterium]
MDERPRQTRVEHRFGAKLRELRESRHLRREELSYRSGVPYATIVKIEQGRQDPRGSTILALARGLACPSIALDELLGVEQAREPATVGARRATGSDLRLEVDRRSIEDLCARWNILEFAFFGSVLTDAFGPASDVDVLVEFDEDARWSLLDLVEMKDELVRILGRPVDIVERRALIDDPNWIRRNEILQTAEPYIVAR